MVWDGMGYASKIHILLLSQFKANHPWQERFAGDISSGVGAATFALKWLDEALQEQYGNKHSDEAMKDFDGVIRVLIIGDLGAALLNGLGATREHFQLMKTMCTTCGAAPVAQVGDGYLKEPISGYGRLAMQAQKDLPIENTNGSPSVGDDVSTLLIWMADFEADMHAQLAASGATGEEACIRGQLQRGGLTPDIKRRLPGVSEATQRARTHASPAWLAVHPGGDLAWEHQYLRAFLEFAAAQMFLMRRDPVWAVYQMRQTPPAVLNAARATEYRIAPQQLRNPDPSLPQPIPTPTHRIAGAYANTKFDVNGRKPSALAADEDILSFQCWALVVCSGSGDDGSISSFMGLPPDLQKECLARYVDHLGPGCQVVGSR